MDSVVWMLVICFLSVMVKLVYYELIKHLHFEVAEVQQPNIQVKENISLKVDEQLQK